MFDLGQQLLGSESWIDVELAIEEFVIGAFLRCLIRLPDDF